MYIRGNSTKLIRHAGLLFGLGVLLWAASSPCQAQLPIQRTFPFSAEDDADGARYVWFIYGQAGSSYEYLPAAQFPHSFFNRVRRKQAQAGDVAWWKDFMAIYDDKAPKGAELLTAPGRRSLAEMERKHGRATWFRIKAQNRD